MRLTIYVVGLIFDRRIPQSSRDSAKIVFPNSKIPAPSAMSLIANSKSARIRFCSTVKSHLMVLTIWQVRHGWIACYAFCRFSGGVKQFKQSDVIQLEGANKSLPFITQLQRPITKLRPVSNMIRRKTISRTVSSSPVLIMPFDQQKFANCGIRSFAVPFRSTYVDSHFAVGIWLLLSLIVS